MHEDTSQIDFPFAGRRQVRAAFDAGPISSDGGLLLLRQADRRLGLTEALAQALPDWREKRRVEHSDLELIRQRIYGICAGYEDCNDAKTMRRDPALKAACDRDPDQGADLASQPTLSRFENEVGPKSCYLLAEKLFESYLQRHKQRPSRLILDLDTTDDPLHGQQELRYFSAYYDEYVYQPLLIFDQDGDLIASVLQPGKSQGTRPAVAVLKRIIHRLRKKWPGVSILVRGDSGFASPELYRLCQDNKVASGPTSFACSCTPPPTSSCICSAAPHTAPSSPMPRWTPSACACLRSVCACSAPPVASGFIWPPAIPGSHFGLASPGGCYRRSPSAQSPTFPSPSIPPPLGRSPALSRPLRGPQSEKPGTGRNGNGNGNGNDREHGAGGRRPPALPPDE